LVRLHGFTDTWHTKELVLPAVKRCQQKHGVYRSTAMRVRRLPARGVGSGAMMSAVMSSA